MKKVCLQFNLAPSTLSTIIKNEQKLWDDYERNSYSTRLHIQSSRYEDLEWTHQRMLNRRLILSMNHEYRVTQKNHERKRAEMS